MSMVISHIFHFCFFLQMKEENAVLADPSVVALLQDIKQSTKATESMVQSVISKFETGFAKLEARISKDGN